MKDKEAASIFIYLEDIIYPDYNLDGENWVNYPYSWMRYIWSVLDIYNWLDLHLSSSTSD